MDRGPRGFPAPPVRCKPIYSRSRARVLIRLDRRAAIASLEETSKIIRMVRTVLTAALILAAGAFGLAWLDLLQTTRRMTPELYVALIAMLFAAGGLWLGWKIATRRLGPDFVRNDAAVRSLGLTNQEMRVLGALASGGPNKEIARGLGLSPHTVKTHLANVFAKLAVRTRTEAVTRARELSLIP